MAFLKKGLAKPLVIFLAAVGLGMFVLGLTLTIIGTLPGYSPYGGNPLKIVGPILLVLGVLIIAGVIVEWCVRTQRDTEDKEKGFVEDYSQPKATFKAPSYPRKKKEVHEPPLQTSTPGNNTHSNPSPAFTAHDILPQSQAKLARADSREGVPLPHPPQQQQQGGRQTGNGYNIPKPQAQKNAHFEPIHQAPPNQSVQYAQVVHAQRQQSSSSANYFFPSVTNQHQHQPQQQNQHYGQHHQPQQQQNTGYINPNGVTGNGHLNGNGNGNKTRWGTSKESLDDHLDADSKNEVPVLDIGNAGRDHGTRRSKGKGGQDKGKGGPGDKYGRTGSYRAAHNAREDGKPTKSPRTQRRGQESERTAERYATENPGYTRERAIDVEGPSQSTPKDRDGGSGGYSSHNTSREAPAAGSSNFNRRNSSRTRRGSKRKPRGQRREHEHDRDHERSQDRDYDRDRSRDRSRERPRERSSSRGRLGLDDSTTLDYVRGVPIDKDSRRKSSSKQPANDNDSEKNRRHHRDREGDARRNYDSNSTSPSDMSHPSDHRSKHKHSTGYNNNAFVDDSRALTPKMSPEDFLNSKEVRDAKNMNFTININAQPGAAVQIALGSQNLPTPRPMITATPLKTDVRTHLSGMSDA